MNESDCQLNVENLVADQKHSMILGSFKKILPTAGVLFEAGQQLPASGWQD